MYIDVNYHRFSWHQGLYIYMSFTWLSRLPRDGKVEWTMPNYWYVLYYKFLLYYFYSPLNKVIAFIDGWLMLTNLIYSDGLTWWYIPTLPRIWDYIIVMITPSSCGGHIGFSKLASLLINLYPLYSLTTLNMIFILHLCWYYDFL